jgi:hypothetical protein
LSPASLTCWRERTRVPIIIPLVLVALVLSAFDLNDNHVMRNLAVNSTTQLRALDVFRLPTAADQFEDWYSARADREDYRDRKYPVYIVAAQGGGIYAAAHLAFFMTLMQEACPKFAQHTFAISSVSGGSIGAAWFTALARKYARNARVSCTPASDLDTDAHADMYQDARSLLERDYLSPLISGALLPDFLQRFLPLPVPQLSRARAFELSLEEAWNQFVARAEGDEPQNPLASGFLELWDPSQSVPALLVNTTEVGSGRRRIIAPFTFAISDAGLDDIAFMPITRSNDIPLSTAVSLSARFPWIAPAGWFNEVDKEGGIHKVRLADGGYFDNSGVATAVDLIDSLRDIKTRSSGAPLPVDINLIVLSTGSYADQRFFGFGEALSPIEALLNTRSAETFLTIDRASDLLGSLSLAGGKDRASDGLAVPRLRRIHVGDFVFRLPLGWRLSKSTSQLIEMQSGHGTHCVPDDKFSQSTHALSYFEGDCVQSLIYHELSGDSLQDAATKLRAARQRLSPAERCADIDTLRSIDSFIRKTSVLFINNTDTPKKLYWLNYSHGQTDYDDIAANTTRLQDTYYSHPWIVREQNGECFGVFVPQPSESAIWLGSRNIKSPAERCSDPSALRSVGDSSPTHVDFVNDTQAPKSLFWLDYQGSPQLYATIAPGESHAQDTYVAHAWMVKDEAGECVGVYLPNSTPTKFNLKPSPPYAGPPSRAR